jgi:hypothetical protein
MLMLMSTTCSSLVLCPVYHLQPGVIPCLLSATVLFTLVLCPVYHLQPGAIPRLLPVNVLCCAICSLVLCPVYQLQPGAIPCYYLRLCYAVLSAAWCCALTITCSLVLCPDCCLLPNAMAWPTFYTLVLCPGYNLQYCLVL